MSDAAYLKERYEGMDTPSLLELWARGGLVDWAEHVLREELQRREVSENELENLAKARAQHQEDIAARRGRSELRSIGLFIAAFLGGILATMLGSLWGPRVGMITFGVVFGGYGVLLARAMRHLRADVNQPGSSVNSMFHGLRQIVFVFFITALCLYGGFWGL